MRKLILAGVLASLGLLPAFAQAAIISVTPDSVNRLQAPVPNTHDSLYFSTYYGYATPVANAQKTLLNTTNGTFLTSLGAVLGPLSGGQSYHINSATLTVGSSGDNYATAGAARAYVVLVPWDPSEVTWNKADVTPNVPWSTPGLAAGVDYSATAANTGVVGTYTTVWSGLGSTVRDWLGGAKTNYGLFFPDMGTDGAFEYTVAANVSWTLDAQIVPEPSAVALLLGLGVMGLLPIVRRVRRRRHTD